MKDDSLDDGEIVARLRWHLAQTVHAASLLHGNADDCLQIEQVRGEIAAAIVNLQHAIEVMETSRAHREAETPRSYRVG